MKKRQGRICSTTVDGMLVTPPDLKLAIPAGEFGRPEDRQTFHIHKILLVCTCSSSSARQICISWPSDRLLRVLTQTAQTVGSISSKQSLSCHPSSTPTKSTMVTATLMRTYFIPLLINFGSCILLLLLLMSIDDRSSPVL